MNKQEFLSRLRKGLSGFPQENVEQHLCFYAEMIDDRIEEGFSEEQAVADLGPVDEILSQIASEIPLSKIVKESVRPKRRLRTWETVLLILGAPLWLSLIIAAFAVVLSVFIVIWSAVISLWAIEVSLWACIPAFIAAAVIFLWQGYPLAAIAMVAVGLIFAGLSIFLFFGCHCAGKGTAALTVSIIKTIKKCFLRKEKMT